MNSNNVSIVTISKNNDEEIERTIKSIICQLGPMDEYIIVDGASTDATVEIVNKYRNNVKCFISEPDAGIYDAINKGIKLSAKNWIMLIHAGDLLEDGVLEKIRPLLRTDAEVIYGGIHIIDDDYNIMETKLNHDHKDLKYRMSIYHPATIISCNAYKKFSGYDQKLKIASDYDFFSKVSKHDGKFNKTDLIIARFKIGGISSTNNFRLTYENAIIAYRYYGWMKVMSVVVKAIKDSLLHKFSNLSKYIASDSSTKNRAT